MINCLVSTVSSDRINLQGNKLNECQRPYSQQFVSDLQPPIFMCGPSLDDLCDVDAVVSWDVLVPDTACYTEAQT